MVQKKRKSKRVALGKKYSIERKVKEHHKKARKEARKNPQARTKLKKDPGIPNLWPFKEQLLDQIEANKQKLKDEHERRRQLSKQEQLEEMVKNAEGKEEAYDNREDSDSEEGYVDMSRKSFFKEFMKVVKASDVIIEVVDARDPQGTRCPAVEQQILQLDPNKKIIIVLNKIDLVPKENVQSWLTHLRNEFPTIAFKAASGQSKKKFVGPHRRPTLDASDIATNESLGAQTLISLLKNYTRSSDMKKSITVGIIGIPNVGKSSLINSLKRAKAVGVGAMPGFTRKAQEVQLDKNIKLFDCPGIIFTHSASEAEAALRNAVKVEQLANPFSPIELIIKRCPKEQLLSVYKIATFKNATDFVTNVATKRNKVGRGGVLDLEGCARMIVKDWCSGKIPYMTRPPERANVHLEASVVPAWGKDFDINAIERIEAEQVFANLDVKMDDTDYATVEALGSAEPESIFVNMANPNADVEMVSEEESDEESDDDEDMESGEESEEEMDTGKPTIKASSSSSTVTRKQNLRDASDAVNPQTNKKKKELAKKQRRADKKRKRDGVDSGDAEDNVASESSEEQGGDEERYDFGADFWSKVDVRQIVSDDTTASVPKKKQKRFDAKAAVENVNDFNV